MHTVQSIYLCSIIVLCVLCGCAYFRGLTSQRAAQCNGILISIIQYKPHYMKLLLHASTQILCTTLVFAYLYFPFFLRTLPLDLPTVSLCYVQYFAPTLRVKVFCTYGYGIRHTVYVYRTYAYIVYLNPDSNFAHELTLTLQSS